MKKLGIVVFSFILVVAFQNCADDLNLSQEELASIQPSAQIAQSVAQPVEASTFQIQADIRNINNYTIRWEKDGAALGGQENIILNFPSLELSDQGDYEAIVTAGNGQIYRTGVLPVRVYEDPNNPVVATVNTPTFSVGNNNYLFYYVAARNAAQQAQITDDYCKAVYGGQATNTAYNATTIVQPTNRYALWFPNGVTCDLNNYDAQAGANFCLFTATQSFNLVRYNSISCNRYPAWINPNAG